MPGGVVGGVVGGTLGGVPGGVQTKRETSTESVAKKPIESVRANAIYDPNCDDKKLAGTKAATFHKRPGSTKVAFCVNESGKVVDVRTIKKFPDDPKVDQICRETVQKWRYRPFMVGGKPQKTCTEVTFDIKFD